MKDKQNARKRRAAGGLQRPLAFILAAMLMVLAMPAGSRLVYAAVDLSQPCSLTVNIGASLPEDDRADLQEADIVYDIYRVADAVAVAGYDTYSWTVLAPFAEALSADGSAAKAYMATAQTSDGQSIVSIAPSIDSAGWKAVAAEAARVALGELPEGTEAMAPQPAGTFAADQYASSDSLVATENALSKQFTGLKAGLYLLVPHGRDIEEYVTAKTNTAGETAQVTVADSRHYRYSFSPEMISLPTKEGLNTAQSAGDWDYDGNVDLTLKFSKEVRVGNLVVTKDLLTYAQRVKTNPDDASAYAGTRAITDPATFIFDVAVYESQEAYEAYQAAGTAAKERTYVYHDYISIVFDGNGDYSITGAASDAYGNTETGAKSARIGNLPIGSYAVVTEAYSGKVYTTDDPQTAVIEVNDNDNTVEVTFENDYDDEHGGGGSVTNRFTYSDENWGWEQMTDDSENAEVIQSKSTQ